MVNDKSKILCKQWLVPRDTSTAAKRTLDPSLGEFKVGSAVLYTKSRNDQLEAKQLLPSLPSSWLYDLVILPKYCDMLGIPQDDMLVHWWQKEPRTKMIEDIDAAFEKLPQDLPLAKRIWLAHESVYRNGYLRKDVLLFIKEKFFPFVDNEYVQ
jgi:hypothetical protein